MRDKTRFATHPLSTGIRRATRFRALGLAALGLPALATAGPEGEDIIYGDVGINRPDPDGTVVDQNSTNAIVNWDSFSVGADEYVRFLQPSSSAVILNRVIGNNASEILGTMEANGHVFLVNPNGVYFGPGASLDVQGFLATTLDIDNAEFIDGNYTFTEPADAPADASVVNDGTITAGPGGYVVLAGNYAENNGVVTAEAGHVVMGAGREMTLDLEGDGLVNFNIDEAALADHAGVKNAGDLIADGGTVIMTADVASDLVTTAVNNEGLVQARSISEQGGEVYLSAGGGDIEHTGTIDAAGTGDADGGKVRVTSNENIHLEPDSRITVRGAGSGVGGDARIVADQDLYFRDGAEIHAESGSRTTGAGGFIEVSGHENILLRGFARAGSGGTYLIDPASVTVVNSEGTAATNEIGINGTGGIEEQLNAGTNVTVLASNQIAASTGAGSLIATGAGNLFVGVNSGSTPTNPTLDIDLTNISSISIGGDLTFDLNNQFNTATGVNSGTINIPKATAANIYIFGGTINTRGLQAEGQIRIAGNYSGSKSTGALIAAPGNVNLGVAGANAPNGVSIAATGSVTASTNLGAGGGILASTGGGVFGTGAITINAGGDVNVGFIDTQGNVSVTGANIGIGTIGNNTTAGSVTLTASSTGTVGNGNVTMGQANTFGSMNSLTVNATGAGTGGNVTIAGLQVTNNLNVTASGGTGGGVIQLGSGGKGGISGGTGGGSLYSFTGNVVDFQAPVYLNGDLTINGNVTGNRVQIGGNFFNSVSDSGSAAFNPNSVTVNGNVNAGSVGIHVEGTGDLGNGVDINGSVSASNDVFLRASQTNGLGTGGSVLVQGPIVSSTGNVTLDAFSDGGTLGSYGGGNIAVGTTGVNSTMAPITAGGSITLSASHTGTGTSAGNVFVGALSAGNAISITAAGSNSGGRIRLGDFQTSPSTVYTPANINNASNVTLNATGAGINGGDIRMGAVTITGNLVASYTARSQFGTVNAGGSMTMDNSTEFVQFTGDVSAGGAVNIRARDVEGTPNITAGGALSVNAAIPTLTLGALTGQNVTVNLIAGVDGATLTVGNVTATGTGTADDIDLSAKADGGNVALNTQALQANAGGINLLASAFGTTGSANFVGISADAGTTGISAGGQVRMTAVNNLGGTGGVGDGRVNVTGDISAGGLSITASGNGSGGRINLGTGSPEFNFNPVTVTTTTGNITLDATGGPGGGLINAGALNAAGNVTLSALGGSNGGHVNLGSYANSGSIFNASNVSAGGAISLSATGSGSVGALVRVGNVTGQGVSIQALTGGTGSVQIEAGSVSATGTGTADSVTVTASSAAGSATGATVNLGNVTTNGGGIALRAGQSGGNTTAASLAVGDVSAAGSVSLAAHGTSVGDLGLGSVNAGNDVVMSALTATTGPVTAGSSLLLGGVGSIAGTNLSLTAGNNVDLSNTVYRIDQEMTVGAGADINASAVDIQAGVVVMEAGGSILNGGAAGTITAGAMGLAAAGDIILNATTLDIGTRTLAGAGVTAGTESLLRVNGDTGLFDGLTQEGIAPTHTDPNASFVAGGQLTLGNVNLQGSYVFLQANAIDLQQNWTFADPDTLMQITPFGPATPTQFENTAADLPGDPSQLELHAEFDFTDVGTLALGESNTYGGDVLIGESGDIEMGSTNVIVATTGSVTGLGKIVSTGVVDELSTLLGGETSVFDEPSTTEITAETTETNTEKYNEDAESESEERGGGTAGGVGATTEEDPLIKHESQRDSNICK